MSQLIGTQSVVTNVTGNTNLVGSTIAQGNYDQKGTFHDGGNLILNTGTLTYQDIKDKDSSFQGGITIGTGFDPKTGITSGGTFGGNIDYSNIEGSTRATIGDGTITIGKPAQQTQDITTLNRDVNTNQIITKHDEERGEITIPLKAITDPKAFAQDVADAPKIIIKGSAKAAQAQWNTIKDTFTSRIANDPKAADIQSVEVTENNEQSLPSSVKKLLCENGCNANKKVLLTKIIYKPEAPGAVQQSATEYHITNEAEAAVVLKTLEQQALENSILHEPGRDAITPLLPDEAFIKSGEMLINLVPQTKAVKIVARTGEVVYLYGNAVYNWAMGKNNKLVSPTITRYNPTTNPGPLSSLTNPRTGLIDKQYSAEVLNSFRSNTYSEVVSNKPVTLYRVYSNPEKRLGAYWTPMPPSGPSASSIDFALHPSFGNKATSVVKIELPPGIPYYQGTAASQGGLSGGGTQVFIPSAINPNWIRR